MCAPKFEENLRPEDFPNFSEFVEETAHQKVLEVENRFRQMGESTAGLRIPDIIIGADTMVTFDGAYRITISIIVCTHKTFVE